ncbi:MAG: NADPH-dependent FMN reductase [Opitutales bacterium]
MKFEIIRCSLSPTSRSDLLAQVAEEHARQAGLSVNSFSLKDHPLPFCDGGGAYGAQGVSAISERVTTADGILLSVPIYNYDVNAAAKNLLEMTGDGWTEKVVGFLCAAGGSGSYMSIMPFANSLMLDYRSVIVPRFVYATRADFEEAGEPSATIGERIGQLVDTWSSMTRSLRG